MRPQLMNFIADALFGLTILCVIVGGMLFVIHHSDRPIRHVVILGETRYVDSRDLEPALKMVQLGNFFEINIDAVRSTIETIPWIRRVDIRRVWPDKLAITVAEQLPAARWQDAVSLGSEAGEGAPYKFVNQDGQIFTVPNRRNNVSQLPLFIGPENAAPDMLQRYNEINQLIAPLRQKLTRLELSSRLAWSLQLSSGLTIQLGREHERVTYNRSLKRFVDIYPQLRAVRPEIPVVADLRYPNGFVLSYKSDVARSVPMTIDNEKIDNEKIDTEN